MTKQAPKPHNDPHSMSVTAIIRWQLRQELAKLKTTLKHTRIISASGSPEQIVRSFRRFRFEVEAFEKRLAEYLKS